MIMVGIWNWVLRGVEGVFIKLDVYKAERMRKGRDLEFGFVQIAAV